VVQKGKVTALR